MIARVASFEGVNVSAARRSMDDAKAIIRPLVEGLAGFKGQLELVADDGHVLSIAHFDSAENAQAADPVFDEEMPHQLGELFADWEGRRVGVQSYEVLWDERR
jgi:uncharacterized protein YmfQ (DUF2313 family)